MSNALSPDRPIAHTAAYAVSTLGAAIGLAALSRPAAFATGWGLPSQVHSPFVYVLGGRNLALGLLLLAFAYRGKLEEVGTVLMCLPVSAGVDAWVTWKFGDRRMVSKHVLPAVLGAGFGWYLQYGVGQVTALA